MKITDIAPRRHRLSQLYIDGEAAVKVDTETLLRRGIAIGDEARRRGAARAFCRPPQSTALRKRRCTFGAPRPLQKELENKITRAEFDREAAQAPWSTWKSWAY